MGKALGLGISVATAAAASAEESLVQKASKFSQEAIQRIIRDANINVEQISKPILDNVAPTLKEIINERTINKVDSALSTEADLIKIIQDTLTESLELSEGGITRSGVNMKELIAKLARVTAQEIRNTKAKEYVKNSSNPAYQHMIQPFSAMASQFNHEGNNEAPEQQNKKLEQWQPNPLIGQNSFQFGK